MDKETGSQQLELKLKPKVKRNAPAHPRLLQLTICYLEEKAKTPHRHLPRMVVKLGNMRYDDSLHLGDWRVEYLFLGKGYPHYRVYYRHHVVTVVDIRTDTKVHGGYVGHVDTRAIRQRLGAFLLAVCPRVEAWAHKGNTATTCIRAETARQPRLLKVA